MAGPATVARGEESSPGARGGFRRLAPRATGILAPLLVLLFGALPVRGAEYVLGAGIVGRGFGARFHVHPDNSHWRFGWEYGGGPADTFEDPYTGDPLTRDDEMVTGPFFSYQFHPDAKDGWYLGASLLRWSRTETSLTQGDSNTQSTTDPYFGGGYMNRLSKHFLFNAGMFLGPGAQLTTETSTSSTEDFGGFDIQITLEFVF